MTARKTKAKARQIPEGNDSKKGEGDDAGRAKPKAKARGGSGGVEIDEATEKEDG
jgi:hypothetical protein